MKIFSGIMDFCFERHLKVSVITLMAIYFGCIAFVVRDSLMREENNWKEIIAMGFDKSDVRVFCRIHDISIDDFVESASIQKKYVKYSNGDSAGIPLKGKSTNTMIFLPMR